MKISSKLRQFNRKNKFSSHQFIGCRPAALRAPPASGWKILFCPPKNSCSLRPQKIH
jgi:hypothetical protein